MKPGAISVSLHKILPNFEPYDQSAKLSISLSSTSECVAGKTIKLISTSDLLQSTETEKTFGYYAVISFGSSRVAAAAIYHPCRPDANSSDVYKDYLDLAKESTEYLMAHFPQPSKTQDNRGYYRRDFSDYEWLKTIILFAFKYAGSSCAEKVAKEANIGDLSSIVVDSIV
jgi:hypothetical protein